MTVILGQTHVLRTCRGCGCTDNRACPGGCAWVLLATLKARHNLLDVLLAMNIARDRSFLPSRSTVWPLLLQGRNAIEKLEAQGQPIPLPQEGTA